MRASLKTAWRWVAVVVPLFLAQGGQANVTNSVPWSDTFETYTNGTLVVGTNGWTASTPDAATATNDLVLAGLLAAYPVGGRSLPIASATHTNVLLVNNQVDNMVRSSSGGVVYVDFMVVPSWNSSPVGQTNDQCAFVVGSNGAVNVWIQDRTAVPWTNVWVELTNSPTVSSNAWSRFTIAVDYSNLMYQMQVNEAAPLVDGKAYTYGGASLGGSWFRMVQTNGVMGALVADASPVYIDDLSTALRSLSWSGSNFTESTVNDGSIDNTTPVSVSLARDTFTGSPGDDLVQQGKLVVGGLPSNLVVVAQLQGSTNLSLSLTNRALVHESANTLSNLVLRFADSAFSMGRASDVSGSSQTNVLTFRNTPSLAYSALAFNESAANDGSIDNTSPLVVTLSNGSFTGTVGEDYATNSSKLVILNLPSGLTGHVVLSNATQLYVTLSSAAPANDVANDVSTLRLQLLPAAFSIGGAPTSSVFNLVTNLSVNFTDPSTLSYGTTTFSETVANDGSVSGTSLTLANKSFNAAQGVDMVASGAITYANLPAGLGLQIVRGASAQAATVTFTGKATSHAAADSISNLRITLTDSAVVGGNAAGIANFSLSNLSISFSDPRLLTYSGTTFTELYGGLIDNRSPVTISVSGDTLNGVDGEDFVAAGRIVVAHLPSGLTAQITRDSNSHLSVRLQGSATSNSSADSVANVSFTFQDSAFAGGNAIYVGNYAVATIHVIFNDSASFNVIPFTDAFESYPQGTAISGYNVWQGIYSAQAGLVTNTPALVGLLPAYATSIGHNFPISGTHTQILHVQDFLENIVHSEANTNVFVDFMTKPLPVPDPPASDVADQCAWYVTTNCMLVIWHSNVVTHAGEWITLSNAPTISTTTWSRMTIESDYVNNLFQVRINEGNPIPDPRGWTAGGVAPTGSWFHMVQHSGSMTVFKMTGTGDGYLDDFAVWNALPADFARVCAGSVFIYR